MTAEPTPEERTAGAEGYSRDKKRLMIGVVLAIALFAVALIASYPLGDPSQGGIVAPGVLVEFFIGWGLVIFTIYVFNRTYEWGE